MNHNKPDIGKMPDGFREPSGNRGSERLADDIFISIRPLAGMHPVFVTMGGPADPTAFFKFRMLGANTPGSLQVIGLRDPEAIEPLQMQTSLHALAERYARTILQHFPSGPYTLLGNCIGGFDAFETACSLQKNTDARVRLLLWDAPGPSRIAQAYRHPLALEHWKPVPTEDREIILARDWFNEDWYRWKYPSIAFHGHDPLMHYLNHGWRQERKPVERFDPRVFSEMYPAYDRSSGPPVTWLLHRFRSSHHQPVSSELRMTPPHDALPPYPPAGAPQTPASKRISIARRDIRHAHPFTESFDGDVHLFLSNGDGPGSDGFGWAHHTTGQVYAHALPGDPESALMEDFRDVMRVMGDVLDGLV